MPPFIEGRSIFTDSLYGFISCSAGYYQIELYGFGMGELTGGSLGYEAGLGLGKKIEQSLGFFLGTYYTDLLADGSASILQALRVSAGMSFYI